MEDRRASATAVGTRSRDFQIHLFCSSHHTLWEYSDKREDPRSQTYSFDRLKQKNPTWLVDHGAEGSPTCYFGRIEYYDLGLAPRSYSPSFGLVGSKIAASSTISFSAQSVQGSAAVAEPS